MSEVEPTVQLDDIADSYGEFMQALNNSIKLPTLPCWIQIGNRKYRVTEDNRKTLAMGMALMLDASDYFL